MYVSVLHVHVHVHGHVHGHVRGVVVLTALLLASFPLLRQNAIKPGNEATLLHAYIQCIMYDPHQCQGALCGNGAGNNRTKYTEIDPQTGFKK